MKTRENFSKIAVVLARVIYASNPLARSKRPNVWNRRLWFVRAPGGTAAAFRAEVWRAHACNRERLITLPHTIGALAAAIFAGLGTLHVFWALGGKLGGGAAVPEVSGKLAFVPSRTATLAVALALFVAALVVLARAGLVRVPLHDSVIRFASLGLGALFVLRAVGDFRLVGFTKRVRNTRFARYDTRLFSPLCLALGASVLWLSSLR
jgi:hypothetical protein